MAEVVLQSLNKNFEEVYAVRDVNLTIRDKEFIVLVGPSGCGKTTTLRMVAGLESVSSGRILIDGKIINDLPPMDRDIAMVFQNYALYPHMSVYDNMAFGLKMRKFDRADIGAVEFAHLEAKGHVVIDAHMRIERIVLEDHRDVAIHRRQVVDDLAVDQDAPG